MVASRLSLFYLESRNRDCRRLLYYSHLFQLQLGRVLELYYGLHLSHTCCLLYICYHFCYLFLDLMASVAFSIFSSVDFITVTTD